MDKKIRRPDIGNDSSLLTIDAAPKYQPIPIRLFKKAHQVEYLTWRNMQVRRTSIERDEFINLKGKSVLDIGCGIGYFGWSNVKIVKSYTGIDSDNKCIKAAQAIKEVLLLQNLRFARVDILHFIEQNTCHYDTGLFLSVYHHLLCQVGWDKARKVLKKISEMCDELYFDMGQKNEHSNKAREKWHCLLPFEDPKIFIQQEVLNNTFYKESLILGETRVGKSKRLLFRFTK